MLHKASPVSFSSAAFLLSLLEYNLFGVCFLGFTQVNFGFNNFGPAALITVWLMKRWGYILCVVQGIL